MCEIRMGGNGVGEGKPANLAKVSCDKKKQPIEMENCGIESVRLSAVRVSGT